MWACQTPLSTATATTTTATAAAAANFAADDAAALATAAAWHSVSEFGVPTTPITQPKCASLFSKLRDKSRADKCTHG